MKEYMNKYRKKKSMTQNRGGRHPFEQLKRESGPFFSVMCLWAWVAYDKSKDKIWAKSLRSKFMIPSRTTWYRVCHTVPTLTVSYQPRVGMVHL